MVTTARLLRARLAWASLLAAVLAVPGNLAAAEPALSGEQIRLGAAAFKEADKGRWEDAHRLAHRIGRPVAAKLLFWFDATRTGSALPYDRLVAFLTQNPDWPSRTLLLRRVEEAMSPGLPPATVVDWFGRHPPQTGRGYHQYARALEALGDAGRARAVVREGWATAPFSATEEAEFLDRFGRHLERADHHRRLDALLWRGREPEALRMLPKVDPGQRALATARLRLRAMGPGVDGAFAKVPPSLANDPGLVYERVRWRRIKGRDLEARQLLAQSTSDDIEPQRWWSERHILARRALAEGHVSEAYRLSAGHGVRDGSDLAEAEWLSGWIALRFLDDPKLAAQHFESLYRSVRFPVSLARGAYWSGRAAEALKRETAAREWYDRAAEHDTSFYGQLAKARLQPGAPLRLPAGPSPSAADIGAMEAHDLAKAARMLVAFGQRDRIDPFVLALADARPAGVWKAAAASLAGDLGRPDLAVRVAKEAHRSGDLLVAQGYPSVSLPRVVNGARHDLERPLVLGIIRQESAYRVDAVSPAGARGLMQLMPGTAREVARKLNLQYSQSKLTTDPQYNLTLGQAYMSEVLGSFGGSYVLSLAAYNAGPSRSRQWLAGNGDPRENLAQAIDWIEMIPFGETRNYVQRTLENLQVYRSMVSDGSGPLGIEKDLLR